MNPRYLLDTDHISLFQRRHALVVARVLATPPAQLMVSIVSVDEQIQGRLTVIRRARTQVDAARGYARLRETLAFFQALAVVDFDEAAAGVVNTLRSQGVRIGTQDLRIAATALVHGVIVVTRNGRDFAQVPGLTIEDWSVEETVW